MKKVHFLCIEALLLAFFAASCNKGCSQDKPATPPASAVAPKDLVQQEKAAPPAIPIQHLNLAGLTEPQKQGLTKFLNDEVCPCGCPKTIAKCLEQEKKQCELGKLIGNWTAELLRAGAPERMLFRAVSEEINKGFLAKPINFDESLSTQKGEKSATITLTEFADAECPMCKIASGKIKEFYEAHPKDVRLSFVHFPLNIHPNAQAAAVAAEAAGLQGKFWEMLDKLFAHQTPLTPEAIDEIATSIFKGANLAKFKKDLSSKALLDRVLSQRAYSEDSLKLQATPSIFINGRPYYLPLIPDFIVSGLELRMAMEKLRNQEKCGE
jgi:hypothetical protein